MGCSCEILKTLAKSLKPFAGGRRSSPDALRHDSHMQHIRKKKKITSLMLPIGGTRGGYVGGSMVYGVVHSTGDVVLFAIGCWGGTWPRFYSSVLIAW